MNSQECSAPVNGLNIAYKTWGDASAAPIIALHGWQDNAATFDKLALHFADFYWVVPDLPGHGRSEHRGVGAEYTIWSYGLEVLGLANALGLERFTLMGHSMGGGIGSLVAGICPERIERLVLLDVLGVIATAPDGVLDQIRGAYRQRLNYPLRRAGQYPSREEAITARARRGISKEAAVLLGARGIDSNPDGFFWCHDQRLTRDTLLTLSEQQLEPFLQAITCPVLLVTSREAVTREETLARRAALVGNLQRAHFDGGHHQHLDGDVAAIANRIRKFIA